MKNLSIMVVAAFLLAACGQRAGDEFVGKWRTIRGMGADVVIAKNGDGFTVDDKNAKFPAILRDGGLHVGTGFGTVDLVIDKASGHLLMGGAELVRVNN